MTDTGSHSIPTYAELTAARFSRRAVLLGAAGAAAATAFTLRVPGAEAVTNGSTLTFPELTKIYDQTHHVASGYDADILVRWGEAIIAGGKDLDAANQNAADQARQFGYNCDFIGYLPLPVGSTNSEHGLLCVNNEYPDPHIMFPGLTEDDASKTMTLDQIRTIQQSWGHSIVEIKKVDGKWQIVKDGEFNRRITGTTVIAISGPAAGHKLLQTSADPTGTKAIGTGYNCAGGVTPWGTVLTCEEGLSDTFGGDPAKSADPKLLDRYNYDGTDYYGLSRIDDRFQLDKEPNESNRFDWVVEIDPYEPSEMPVKRTALGRFGHEAATSIISADGRVVVYTGDDGYFEYLYRFVSAGKFDPANRAANKKLLDDGTLFVAKFDGNGTLTWIPLIHGQNGLTAENGFADQAEVLIKARLAGDVLGATKMDRPEDMEPNPVTGRVYVVMTKNAKRKADQVDPANPRAENKYGHILEMVPPGEGKNTDHTADTFQWDVFLLAGDPSKPEQGAKYNAAISADGWFVAPDNIAFDPKGRIWIASDGANDFGIADGLYGADTVGDGRALPRFFFACPTGAELCGPAFTPDGKTLFVAVQHPAENSEGLDKLTTRWPDFGDSLPRPSVVAITKQDGGEIGG